jgi:hypothetical protein
MMSIALWEKIVRDLGLTQSMIKTRAAVTDGTYLPPSTRQLDDGDDDDNDIDDKRAPKPTYVVCCLLVGCVAQLNVFVNSARKRASKPAKRATKRRAIVSDDEGVFYVTAIVTVR